MDDARGLIGLIAGIILFLDFVLYAISVIQKKTKPARATWLIWSLVGFLIFLSYHSSGAINTVWSALTYFIGPLMIAVLSLWYGVGGWTKLDKICLSGSVLGLALWIIFDSSFLALLTNISIDFLGLLPTLVKTYRDPTSEDKLPWTIGFLGSIVNIFAIEKLKFAIIIYPLYMLFNTGAVLYLSSRKKSNNIKKP